MIWLSGAGRGEVPAPPRRGEGDREFLRSAVAPLGVQAAPVLRPRLRPQPPRLTLDHALLSCSPHGVATQPPGRGDAPAARAEATADGPRHPRQPALQQGLLPRPVRGTQIRGPHPVLPNCGLKRKSGEY